jgi:hypothetical protein
MIAMNLSPDQLGVENFVLISQDDILFLQLKTRK